MKLTQKQRLKDEQVLAAILAGAKACGRKVLPHFSSMNGFGVESYRDARGPCCAVGVGVLYAGVTVNRNDNNPVPEAFARAYGVSAEYAMAVSSGFENAYSSSDLLYERSLDERRGSEVGRAAFQILCLDGAGA